MALPETSSLRARRCCFLVPRAAADTRGQHGTLHHAGASVALCCVRAAEGAAGEEERRRDEGTGERAKAKEVARAAGAKAAGAWVAQ
jgi:hypothetical protein